ncbi:MAG: hypothetical protein RJA57_370 [Bacteroidota bacterium]|jgi:aldose 1-epimerase
MPVIPHPITNGPGSDFFGKHGADDVFRYTLQNASGMLVRILNLGCTITEIHVPDRNGILSDVVLGFDALEGYLQPGNPYFGCIIGRCANRIRGAAFSLDGKEYRLAMNAEGSSLHGGIRGFDKYVWVVKSQGIDTILFSRLSPDGEEGYPGDLTVDLRYTVRPDNSLQIDYRAECDRPSPVNMTNHSYFNLSGGSDPDILEHEIQLEADHYTPLDGSLLPIGTLEPVAGTSMDFTQRRLIRDRMPLVSDGFDHNMVLRRSGSAPFPAATLLHRASGRVLQVSTTEPGLQFYTGNFLDGSLIGKGGVRYGRHAGLCLEAQAFPDALHHPSFPAIILRPGQVYQQQTVYRFGVFPDPL